MWKEEENGTARVNEARFAEAKSTLLSAAGLRRRYGCGGMSLLPDDDERRIQGRWRKYSSQGCGGDRGGEIEVGSKK